MTDSRINIEEYKDYSLFYAALMYNSYDSALALLKEEEKIDFSETHDGVSISDLLLSGKARSYYESKSVNKKIKNFFQKLHEKNFDFEYRYDGEKNLIEKINELYYKDNNLLEHIKYLFSFLSIESQDINIKKIKESLFNNEYTQKIVLPEKKIETEQKTHLISICLLMDKYENDFIQILKDNDFDINTKDKEGCSALFYLIQNSRDFREINIEYAQSLFERGFDFKAKDNKGYDLLDYLMVSKNLCFEKEHTLETLLEIKKKYQIDFEFNQSIEKNLFFLKILYNDFHNQKKLKDFLKFFKTKYEIDYKKITDQEQRNLLSIFLDKKNIYGMHEMSNLKNQWNKVDKKGLSPLMKASIYFDDIVNTYKLNRKTDVQKQNKTFINMIEKSVSDKEIEKFNESTTHNFSKAEFLSNQVLVDFFDLERKIITESQYKSISNTLNIKSIKNIFKLKNIEENTDSKKMIDSNIKEEIKLDNLTLNYLNKFISSHLKQKKDYQKDFNDKQKRHYDHVTKKIFSIVMELEPIIHQTFNTESDDIQYQSWLKNISQLYYENLIIFDTQNDMYLPQQKDREANEQLMFFYNRVKSRCEEKSLNMESFVHKDTIKNLKTKGNSFYYQIPELLKNAKNNLKI